MRFHTLWQLVHIGAVCGWFTLCAAAGIASYVIVIAAPILLALWFLKSRRTAQQASAPTAVATAVAPSGDRRADRADWTVALAAGAAVLALYWFAVSGHVPVVN